MNRVSLLSPPLYTSPVAAGTVVDSGVTHPYLFEFYLQAHAGLKGTAKVRSCCNETCALGN